MTAENFQNNILILPDRLISHLQRIENVLANELTSLYEYQEYLKQDCAHHYKFAEKNTKGGESHFRLLNIRRNDYRANSKRIKNLEDTQREIRRIIRDQ